MKRRSYSIRCSILSSIVAALTIGGLTAVAAVAAPLAQPSVPQAKPDIVVVTGCVAAGATSGQYMLRNAAVQGVSATLPNIMHSAPAADTKKEPKQVTYVLKGGDMKAHVGHRVSVTGTLDAAKPTPKGSATAPPSPATTMSGDARTLNVTSTNMVAATCS